MTTSSNSAGHTVSIISRAENLIGQRRDIGLELTDLWREAKSAGHDVKAMKLVLRRRQMTKADVDALDDAVATIEAALGDLKDTPLGGAALKAAS